ncbi:MAG: hypothetical protein ABL959_13200 [Pyrinomonadaceae bacterium]
MPRILLLSLIALSTICAFGQNPSDPKKTPEPEKLTENAVEFLRETSQDLARMRSVENRISFSAEMASLMWFHNEKEARAMYGTTITDFKQLLSQLDGQMNTLDIPVDDDFNPSFLFGGSGRSPVERKLRIAMAVRQQIALSLAEHDPETAYSFFYDTASLITNAKFRKDTEQSDKYFELQLIKQIAETNATMAAKFGASSIKDGVDGNHVELLKKIYAKDADKGIEFGSAILSKVKSGKNAVKGLYVFSSLLSYGAENIEASKKPKGKKPIYSQSDLRDIAEAFAQVILDGDDEEASYSGIGFAEQIGKFAPGRAAQIKAKFRKEGGPATAIGTGSGSANFSANPRVMNTGGMGANANTGNTEAEQKRQAEEAMMKEVMALNKSVPKEEREKITAKARKIIATTPGKDKKITALSMLAAQVAKAGDKELADEIMRDAERLINPQPKNYRDFLFTWLVASGYAEANPDKAFPMLEDAILRANETISAFVKVAEFVDVNEEMIDDGEVQVGMFGGQMIRSMTRELGIANTTLISLAKADFVKTKALTNSFDRVEVRVLAKMLILRAVLDKNPKKDKSSDGFENEDNGDGAPPPPKPRTLIIQ